MFNGYRNEIRSIIGGLIQIAYWMRGSIQYHDLMNTTIMEREEFTEFIEKRLEAESKKPNPVY